MFSKFKKLIEYILLDKIVLLILVVIISLIATYFLGPHDKVAEIGELIIKLETGKDVDFSPNIPEKPEQNLKKMILE